jgi:glycosyltransferase involved in cell wall biosynthesis
MPADKHHPALSKIESSLSQSLAIVRSEGSVLSVIVPVYYNAESLPLLFDELQKFESRLGELKMNLELIFVDDGSGDNSFEALMGFRERRPGTKVVKLSRNFGAPAATKLGQQFVTGDCFLYLPADLQEPLDHVLEMLPHWIAGEKFVISTRATRGDPPLTRFYASLYYRLLRLGIASNYPLSGIGLMLMDKAMLSHMANGPQQINLNMYAYWLGFRPKELAYHRGRREQGRSRWTFWRKVNYFIDTFTGFSPVPIRVMSVLGFITASLSVVYAAVVFISALTGHITVSGFAALAVLVSFLGGCILFMLGIIGEYLWRIFIQVSGRPEAVIAEIHT